MTTQEAFAQFIESPPRGISTKVFGSRRFLSDLRVQYREGQVSPARMEEVLIKAGWKKKPEKWSKPKEEIK